MIDRKFHRYLIDGQKTRTKSDYDMGMDVSEAEASDEIAHAEEFLQAAEQFLAPPGVGPEPRP